MTNLRTTQYAGPHSQLDIRSYISGYFDGEGCFCVAISPRATLVVGWEVRPSVSISQNGDRSEVIELVKEHFGCGTIRPDRSDKTIKWETRRLSDLVERVLPHFRVFPLLSGKRRDVELLDHICSAMRAGRHRTESGLLEIASLAKAMNPSGSRRYTVEMIEATMR
ncbi:MAG: LAGLIDADG family homing endonuclease [Rhodothermales bacterium]